MDVSISGDIAAAGAPGEDSGLNGDQQDNSMWDAGAAYVFIREGTRWSQEAYLKAPIPDSEDYFGKSVSVSGDTIVVGSYGEDGSDGGVNGDPSKKSVNTGASGAAYVFVKEDGTWSQQAYLKAFQPMQNDEFGFDVSIAGNLIVVGAPWEDSSVDGSGGAFVFSRDGETWGQQEFLKSSEPKYNELLGWAVSASEFSLAVGCPWWSDESSSPSKNFRIPSMSEASSGDAAYIFIDPSAPRPTAVPTVVPTRVPTRIPTQTPNRGKIYFPC